MPKTRKPIVREIQRYMDGIEGLYEDWYVGIAEDARDALFGDHRVDKEGDLWIYRTATSSRVAHGIRDFFTTELGADGVADAVDGDPRMVYAYRKAGHTEP
jgi:hypothetical protein